MANVLFKRGLQASLPTTGQEGAFYLTTDTHRLYAGFADGTVAPLDERITIVSDANSMPNASDFNGQFCYITKQNIFAISDGTKWTQINPDTDTNDDRTTKVTNVTASVSGTDSIKVDFTLEQKTYDLISTAETAEPNKTFGFTVASTDLAKAITAGVGVTSASTNSAVLGLEGLAGITANGSTTIEGADGITVIGDASTNKITIKGTKFTDTTYDLTSPEGSTEIQLKGYDGSADRVTLKVGTDLNVDGDTSEEITFSHAEVERTNTAPTATVSATARTLTAVTGITTSDTGHITGVTTTTYTLPEDKDTDTNTTYTLSQLSADNEGKIHVTLKGSDGSSEEEISGKDLYYKYGTDTISNQGDIQPKVTAEIQAALRGVDAMRYKGTIDNAALPTTNVQIGDTYKVTYGRVQITNNPDSGNTLSVNVGDLLIATGTEDPSTGIITGEVMWTHVPGDTNSDTWRAIKVNGTQYLSTAISSNPVDFINGTKISMTGNSNGKITINHSGSVSESTNTTATLDFGGKVEVPVYTLDDTGHIATAATKTYTLPSKPVDNNTTYVWTQDSTTKNKIVLKGLDDSEDAITWEAGTDLSVAGNITDKTITYTHKTYTDPTEPTLTSTFAYGGKLTMLAGVTTSNGHVTGYTTKEVTLPAAPITYTLSGAATSVSSASNRATISTKDTLTGSDTSSTTSTMSFSIGSNTMQVTNSGTAITADIVWDSF